MENFSIYTLKHRDPNGWRKHSTYSTYAEAAAEILRLSNRSSLQYGVAVDAVGELKNRVIYKVG